MGVVLVLVVVLLTVILLDPQLSYLCRRFQAGHDTFVNFHSTEGDRQWKRTPTLSEFCISYTYLFTITINCV